MKITMDSHHQYRHAFMVLILALVAGTTTGQEVPSPSASPGPALRQDALGAEMSGLWDEAIRLHKLEDTTHPLRADAWKRIALIESNRGNTNLAITAMEEAARLAPQDASLQVDLSQRYAMANRPKDALVAIEKAIAIEPENTAYLHSRASLANWLGNTAVAAESCLRILELKPDDPGAALTLARVRSWQGKLNESVRLYRRYIRRFPDQPDPYIEYARLESWRGNFNRADQTLKEYGKQFGNPEIVDRERARILASANKPDAAMALNEPLLQKAPADFELQFTRAIALHYDNQPKAAADTVETLAALRPDSPEVTGIRDFVEANRRSNIRVGGRIYRDIDDIRIRHGDVTAEFASTPDVMLRAGVEANRLVANTGSGLEATDGTETVDHHRFWAGTRINLLPSLGVDIHAGQSEVVDVHDIFAYGADLNIRPVDSIRLKLGAMRDFVLISPRSASLAVRSDAARVEAQWEPDLLYTVVAAGRFDRYSDTNERWEGVLAPRRSVLRTEDFNLDLGVRASLFGYSDDLASGYYDPSHYEQYAATGFGYWKIAPETGLGIVAAAGFYQDDVMSRFKFGWGLDAELTTGAFSDWMFTLSGHAMENFREVGGGAFRARAASVSLTRRF